MTRQPTPEETAEHLSGVLDSLEEYARHFVRMPESTVPAVVAWIAHTYLTDENGFPACVTPRLLFTSRKPGGGKSTALAVVQRLSRNGRKVLLPSKAGWMNLIEREHAVICLEEMDKTFPKPSSRIDIQAAINGGYEPDGGTIPHGNREVPMHAFFAGAGLGPVLETNEGLSPMYGRALSVEMETVYGVRFPEYDGEKHGRATAHLRAATASAIETAVQCYGVGLRAIEPALLPGVDARRDQIWRVLRRVGYAAGPVWDARIEEACTDMEAGRSGASPVLTQQQRIMSDVREVTYGESVISSQELIDRLRALPESPWAFLWPKAESPGVARELSALLAPHGLAPTPGAFPLPGGIGVNRSRGYRLADHRSCPICPQADPYTDELGSRTDDRAADTDAGTDTDDPRVHGWVIEPPAPRQRPVSPTVPTFSG